VGKFTSKDRAPSSAAIRLPTTILATKFRLLVGLAETTEVADITNICGDKAVFFEDEKRFSADVSGNARLWLHTRRR
jgi:hypothetical protein